MPFLKLAVLAMAGVFVLTLPLLAQQTSQPASSTSQAASQPTSAPAEATTQKAEAEEAPHDFWHRSTMTDNWFGVGKTLEQYGVKTQLAFTQLYQQNLQGGRSTQTRIGRYAGRWDWRIDVDLDKLAKIPGGSIFMLTRGGWTNGINNPAVGALFNVDNIATDTPIFIKDLFYQQRLFNDKVAVRIGKIDLTNTFQCRGCPATFDGNTFANDETTQFVNSSLINNPSIPFPEPGLGAVLYTEPIDGWYFSGAVADANAKVTESGFNTAFSGPAEAFNIYETGITPAFKSANGFLQGAYRAGFWLDGRRKPYISGEGYKTNDMGMYLSFDQMLYRVSKKDGDNRGLGVFGRYGFAGELANPTYEFWSAGAQYQGLIPTRDNDVLAFGFAQGSLSEASSLSLPYDNETVFESYYRCQITSWLHISPDYQYIFHPSGELPNASVIGVRVYLNF